jgi:hypothetical protein
MVPTRAPPPRQPALGHRPRAGHAGAFQHQIDAREIERAEVARAMEGNLAPVHHQRAGPRPYSARPGAENAVVVKEIGAGLQRFDIVDTDQIEFGPVLHEDP